MKRIFEKAFTPPFKVDDMLGWVWDANHNFAFQFLINLPKDKAREFENIINGNAKPKIKNEYKHEEGVISINGKQLILMRGWGYLTGTGGLNLDSETAADIQDDLADYIVEKLNRL